MKLSTPDLMDLYTRLRLVAGTNTHVVGVMAINSFTDSGWTTVAWSRDIHGTYHYLVMKGKA